MVERYPGAVNGRIIVVGMSGLKKAIDIHA